MIGGQLLSVFKTKVMNNTQNFYSLESDSQAALHVNMHGTCCANRRWTTFLFKLKYEFCMLKLRLEP